jgi:hypothetical protein
MYIRLSFANEDFCSKLSEPQRRFALRIQHFSENSYSIPKYAEFLMTQPLASFLVRIVRFCKPNCTNNPIISARMAKNDAVLFGETLRKDSSNGQFIEKLLCETPVVKHR